ncbi:hypothetical protein CDG81_21880 [Actinopolyspora erythraea]|uniref:YbaB/EbfC family DNA-binding protein n=1 Tax=Actinopolyspora erythraea TaxID=414996 RepID=A0A099DAQ5_9ACTN|nr:hypothetical protein [Actinopolyspora erythraea]ASU80483.1 hypothetical protein CDG81_21880 [Actinopolyspora erythraea]KGI82847.1 hypothetical protein IL38_02985 [Actinopolyspora erythraea]
MGELAERLDRIRVRASAPGVDLEAELRNRSEVTLTFGESAYEFVDERFLERALAGLARRLYTGWVRQYREAISTTNLNIEPNDQHDTDFEAEMRAVEVSVESDDGRITISTVGMQDFNASIRRGTVRELSEREFVSRVAELTPRLIQRFQAEVAELKVRYYG